MDLNKSTMNFAFGHKKFTTQGLKTEVFFAFFVLILDGLFVFLLSHFTAE